MLFNFRSKKMKINFRSIAAFFLCFMLFSQCVLAQSPPSVVADSVVLIEATTGQIIYSKNMNTAYPPASTTKTMTALITLENCDLDEMITVPAEAVGIEGSKIWILEGEKISVKDMLRALLMESANDVATALAIHVAGDVDSFADMMNKRADELGLENTNFVNPHGLYDPKHKTSAYDLAKIMRELIKHPEYIEISKTRGYMMPPTSKAPDGRPLWNGNKLILSGSYYYPYAEAGKTGYTIQSQHSYVASAQKDGLRLVAALVHDKEKRYFTDVKNLFNYGFDNYKLEKIYSQGDVVSELTTKTTPLRLVAQEDVFLVVPKDFTKADISIDDVDLTKMYKPDDVVTIAQVKGGKQSVTLNLVAYDEYLPPDYEMKKLAAMSSNISSSPGENYSVVPFFVLVLSLIALLIIVRVYQIKKSKKRKRRVQ